MRDEEPQLSARLRPVNFADGVRGGRPANLAVLPVNGLHWSDGGAPERVMGRLARLGVRPAWAEPPTTQSA